MKQKYFKKSLKYRNLSNTEISQIQKSLNYRKEIYKHKKSDKVFSVLDDPLPMNWRNDRTLLPQLLKEVKPLALHLAKNPWQSDVFG